MADLGSLFVRLGLDAREFTKGMSKSKEEIKGVQNHTKNLGDGIQTLKRIAIAGFAGWGIKKIADEFLEASKASEGFKVRLNALLGSTQEGNRLFKEMSDYASRVPFEFREIMEAATNLSGVMRGGVDEISKWMPLIGDLAAATGMSLQEVTGQVIRMYSAGAASADMFRERGTLAMLGFMNDTKYSAEETRKIMFESWNKTDSQFKGITEELAKTWSGTMSMFKDQWFQFRNMVMDSGPFLVMKEQAQDLRVAINKLKDEGKLAEWANDIARAILTSFKVGVSATKLLVDAVRGLYIEFSGLIVAVTSIGLAWIKLEEILGKTPLIGKLTGFFLPKDYDERLKGVASELEHLREAGLAWGNELVDALLDSDNAFVRLKKSIDAATGALGGEKTVGKKAIAAPPLSVDVSADMKRFEEQAELMMAKSQETLLEKTAMEKFMEDDLTEYLYDMRQKRLEDQTGFAQSAIELRQWEHDAALQIAQMQAEEEIEIEEYKSKAKTQALMNWAQAGMNIMVAIRAFTGKENKVIFAMAKGLEVAKATMSAFAAATMALASPPGPPWTIPLSHAVLGMGLANAAAIAAVGIAEMGAMGGGGGGGAIATGQVPLAPVPYASPIPAGEQAGQLPTLTINIQGDFIGDESYIEMLAEKISKAVEDRDVRLIASNSRFAEALS